MDQYNEAIRVVTEVGQNLLKRMEGTMPEVHRKEHSHQNLVTDFDLWVQNQLLKNLSDVVPEAKFFAEEQENQNIEGMTWIIDPIDGTTNFVSTRQNFAICVALYQGPTPVFGIVYAPVEDKCYHAKWNTPAYLNDRRLPVRSAVQLENSLFDVSLATLNALSRRAEAPLFPVSRVIRGHRALGAASLSMCHIAEGTLDGYLSSKLFPWDYAAAGVILKACGGVYDTLFGEPLLSPFSTPVLCCGDQHMYELLAPYFRGETSLATLEEVMKK